LLEVGGHLGHRRSIGGVEAGRGVDEPIEINSPRMRS
jgi:hypothetical protein